MTLSKIKLLKPAMLDDSLVLVATVRHPHCTSRMDITARLDIELSERCGRTYFKVEASILRYDAATSTWTEDHAIAPTAVPVDLLNGWTDGFVSSFTGGTK